MVIQLDKIIDLVLDNQYTNYLYYVLLFYYPDFFINILASSRYYCSTLRDINTVMYIGCPPP